MRRHCVRAGAVGADELQVDGRVDRSRERLVLHQWHDLPREGGVQWGVREGSYEGVVPWGEGAIDGGEQRVPWAVREGSQVPWGRARGVPWGVSEGSRPMGAEDSRPASWPSHSTHAPERIAALEHDLGAACQVSHEPPRADPKRVSAKQRQ